ncbi:MAG: hypothetical protein ACE362_26435 [Phaeodactylibacter xiamenensis]|uniref:Uncharacterized protein n=1 Tax=Phaeodactylibacter xiamenensis TaxID=1524460 RepID=A0A098S9K9_9BACT|nr:hypothetical protein [Phaeodactylibacter xiamenensis]KGE89269.1 hypothetical protein IX84_02730 [Phaeodactylibacter xiamenensis]MCR9055061.1 shufflon system plasmid conjugative transfer pilus tip adhesin PilV [bacterium]
MKNLYFILCLLFAGSATVQAQIALSVQGTVQNFDGTAVDNGEYDITFKLYETDAGGTAIWETTETVNVVGGVYSVLLGESTPLDIPFNTTYHLGITLPGGPELMPRAQLTSSPYALSVVGQDNTFPSTGPVGVGTTQPESQQALHVVGNTKLQGNLGITGTVTGNNVNFTNINTTGSINAGGSINADGSINAGGDIRANNGKPVTVGDEKLRIIRGSVNANGTIEIGSGFTVNLNSNTGVYTITFNSAFSSRPVVTVSGAAPLNLPAVDFMTPNSFRVQNWQPNVGWGGQAPFFFIAVGPR